MTIQEFLERLEKVKDKYEWKVCLTDGAIQGKKKEKIFCPITAIASGKKEYSVAEYVSAGESLGLSEHDLNELTNAIDADTHRNQTLRNKILKILGLSDPRNRQIAKST
jgi:hypothetical protein